MKKILSLALIALAMGLNAAYAQNASYTSAYLVRAHFDSSFYGTPVDSVLAHVGVVSGKSWPVAADIELRRQNGGFFGKAQIGYKYEDGYGLPNGLSVVYLVRLSDGRQIWTDTAWVPVVDQQKYYAGCSERTSDCLFPGAGKDLFDAFEGCSSAEQTYATRFTTYE